MNELQIFNNTEFGSVRIIEEGDKYLFCGADVAKALGYVRPKDAIAAHAKGAVKRRTLTNGGEQEMSFIPEGDVYRLITHSKLPSAERFEKWVFDEVLPGIRRHGAYMTPEVIERTLTDPDYLIRLATALKEEQRQRRALEEKVKADAPKVLFAGAVETAQTSILVGELAKLLRQNGVELWQNRLFSWLREKGYLIKGGSARNLPTQRAMERGLFEIKETVICHSDGHTSISKTPKVTGAGQVYFVNLLLKEARGA